ncbi:dihydrolipoamide acetyltransferase component of pyruvate dehydrogenase complex [Streptomyces sulfonofaciens]|uniref:Dihydrolipoamide acetyltransferase component of pyruvate dehydrogenase complex n=1 Tax=Streptomyces sulfonofaciens TaxID=68272 RepID=A0A919KSN3_9ACTN|nr:dihydrolipoamide acetyltransferase family protein [Streptomyces sulfonofaciens]GHH70526.1 dihydrolipoamide acetyltransferase component of pyruvate dehydrogenase complex [Streptomyces sulfonofaciens]
MSKVSGAVGGAVREFRMPDVGEGLTEAEILKWYVRPGDAVTDGQVVCEVETAKAAVELPIPYDGVVADLHYPEGTTVDVGQVIIAVDVSGGAAGSAEADSGGGAAGGEPGGGAAGGEPGGAGAPSAAEEAGAAGGEGRQPVLVGYGVSPSSSKRRPRKNAAAEALQAELNGHGAPAQAARAAEGAAAGAGTAPAGTPSAASAPSAPAAVGAPADGGARPLAKPPVRKLAKDLGVDLAGVAPSGPDGIITREDVHAAAAAAAPPAPPAPAGPAGVQAGVAADAGAGQEGAAAAGADGARETRIPVKGVRKATAQAMVGSAFTAPHVTEWVTVDVTRTMKLIDELKRDADTHGLTGLRVNPLLMIAKALLVAIRRNPAINASWDEERQEIVQKHYVNLGIAAATPRGLIVPNIKDAHAKTLPELAGALSELVSTAREGRTTPGAMQGGTVTITNVGVFGIDSGTPILNPGESAILAVGAIRLQPWVHKGKVKPRQVTTLALSFDHRLVDGELGSKVLADVAAVLEEPKRLISWG